MMAMTKQFQRAVAVATLTTAAWAGAALVSGCSDDNGGYSAESEPRIDVKIDAKSPPSGGQCSTFVPDDSRGQLTYRKYVEIKNTGADTGNNQPLCLSWTSTKANSQFKLNVISGATKDDAKCPGKMAALVIGATLKLEIEYKANESGDTEPLKLNVTHNDPSKSALSYCFGLATVGVQPVLQPSEYTFVNTTSANPATQCFKLLNNGTSALSFQGASFDPSNDQYTLVKVPNASDEIAPKGSAGNPDGSKSLEICVRYKPDATKDNEDVKLVVETNAKPSMVTAKISAKMEAEATFTVDCSNPTGKVAFVFAEGGKTTSTCKVVNAGPPPLVLKQVEVQALNAADKDAVAQVYSAQLLDVAGNPQSIFSAAAGKSASLVVTYKAPATGAPPPAQLVVTTSSAGAPSASLFIAIEAGGCASPVAPQFGPSPELWSQSKVGVEAKSSVFVANQGCAPLQLVNACVAPASYKGTDPCSAPSKNHSLANNFLPVTVQPYSTSSIEIAFKPATENLLVMNDLLHVFYCTGSWSGGQCNGGQVVSRSLVLTGALATANTPTRPEVALSVVDDPSKLALNTPVKLMMAVTNPGSFADKTFYYRWVVAKRPAGSTTWIPEGEQNSDQTPSAKVLPDLPGEYEIVGQAQGYDEATSAYAWSPQASVKFTIPGP